MLGNAVLVENEDEDYWLFVIKVQSVLILLLLLTFYVVGYCSRDFRIFVVWLSEIRNRESFRRLVAGQ